MKNTKEQITGLKLLNGKLIAGIIIMFIAVIVYAVQSKTLPIII